MLSVQELGKFLQQTVYPIAVRAGFDGTEKETFKKIADILASAGNDATITLDTDIKAGRIDASFRISGKTVQAIAAIIKAID
jgi:hypothetical protein